MVDLSKREALTPPLPSVIVPATELRASVLAASLALVRERGLEARYWAKLDPGASAGMRRIGGEASWVRVDLALAHYRVLDQLFPLPSQQVENGRAASDRTQGPYLQTLARLARSTGQLNPRVGLRKLPAALSRMWNGGGAGVAWATGPKDARIEMYGFAILDVPYVKHGWLGMIEQALGLTTKRVYVRLDPTFSKREAVAYDLSWV